MFCLRDFKLVCILVYEIQRLTINFCFLSFIYLIYHHFSYGSTALVVLSLRFIYVSRSHSQTPHSVGNLWTSCQVVAETST